MGAILMLLRWFRLTSHLKFVSSIGIYIVAVELIFTEFSKYSCVLFLYLFAFSLSFHSMLPSSPGFRHHFITSTLVMMLGEMNYGDLLESNEDLVPHNQWLFNIIFVAFLIVMPFILMNLFTGTVVSMAVGNLMRDAEYRIIKIQIEYIHFTERLLGPCKLCKGVQQHSRVVKSHIPRKCFQSHCCGNKACECEPDAEENINKLSEKYQTVFV